MALKQTQVINSAIIHTSTKRESELLDELASLFYDAYKHDKEKHSDKIEISKGQIAENEGRNIQ